jgi:hypothetical protein
VKPDIIYSIKDEGEILVEWDTTIKKLSMKVFVDFTNVYQNKHKYALELAARLEKIKHPNILNFLEPAKLINDNKTLMFKTEAPDHISTWK